jgi:hypothetical protein
MRPVLDVPGVMVGGSQAPNLLQPEAASTLVVSRDVDLVVPVDRHPEVKAALACVESHAPAPEEPSVWLPRSPDRLEVNFIGLDPSIQDSSESYVLEDDRLPLLVFGLLSLLAEGRLLELPGLRARLPRPAGLLLEKLLTERSGLKGERDLLVALGLLLVAVQEDLVELTQLFSRLSLEAQRLALDNLTVLSLLDPMPEMPDPTAARREVAALIERLEGAT